MTSLSDQFDSSRLDHLLALVGPALAPDLLRQLDEDLSGCSRSIADAARETDWKALRDGSHVLISLAGSAGAVRLHALAQSLNAAAHERDSAALENLLPGLTTDLQTLIAIVRARSAASLTLP
ncbi:MAG: hypothetical protein MUE52_05780 [Tabrizicola sp.]|jgi:HPt (histidine-containing phosphotransfer) domain-containing protein|nr:hypothetical protein [Tabrizicola sp.]